METRGGNKRKIGKPENKRGRNRGNKTKQKLNIEVPNTGKCQREQNARGKHVEGILKKIMRKHIDNM